MVSLVTSSAVDRGFEPRSGKNKHYKIGNYFIAAKQQSYGERAKIGWLEIRIMCSSEATCQPADCCSSELELFKYN